MSKTHQSKSTSHSNFASNTLNSAFQTCSDISDAVELFIPQQLYLKPVAKLNISVQLPQLKLPGKTISNWEVMEKLKAMVKPIQFTVLKVSKSTLEFIRFEGEIENKSNLNEVVARLDIRTIKLSGFSELLKIRAAEAKTASPTRHTWDSYFRDAKNMNEMKPGERPDTIHLSNLPSRWFSSRQENGRGSDKPSEYVFRKVFEQFGEVRSVDIPMLDPYRSQMKAHISGLKIFSFGQEMAFEGYVQYKEYVCFVKAMDALRGMKLLHKEGDKAFTASIKIDFDRTKHLSDASIRKRQVERERLMAKEREQEEQERRALEEAEMEAECVRKRQEDEEQLKAQLVEERRQRKAERRQARQLRRLKREEAQRMNYKIAVEERKLLIAQRKLESIRLLDELFERVKSMRLEEMKKESSEFKQSNSEANEKEDMEQKERELRSKLMKKYKSMQEIQLKGQQEKLRQTVESRGKVPSVSILPRVNKSEDSDCESDDSSSSSSSSASEHSGKESETRKDTKDSKKISTDDQNPWCSSLNTPPPPGLFPMDFHGSLVGFNPAFAGRFPYSQSNMFGGKGRWPDWSRYPRNQSSYMMQNCYYGMSEDYHKYFSKLAGQGGSSRSRSRSRSHSKARRRRTRSHSRSPRSRRSRSRSRTSKTSRKSRSRNYSKKSRSNSKSKSSLKARDRSRSRSHSKSRTTAGKASKRSNSPPKSQIKVVTSKVPMNSSSKNNNTGVSHSSSPVRSSSNSKSSSRKRSAVDKGSKIASKSVSESLRKGKSENTKSSVSHMKGVSQVTSIKSKKKNKRKKSN